MNEVFFLEPVSILNCKEVNESTIQEEIAKNPSIIGLGDLILLDRERNQPKAGRLDLLLQDSDSSKRFEVEIQLGKSDESHLVRTLEYWDIEKRRYPNYEHVAVLIAEDITSRFLNVIGLFNGFIPLVAIQMNAFKVEGGIGIAFSKILDHMPIGIEEEEREETNRDYWLKQKASESTLNLADDLLEIINSFKEGYSLKYNKFYIGLAKGNSPNNFVRFRPNRSALNLELRLPKSTEVNDIIEQNKLDSLDYDSRWQRYRIRIFDSTMKNKREVITDLLKMADRFFNGGS